MSAAPVRCVACGVFRGEWALLDPGLRARLEPVFLDSMLHMRPAALEAALAAALPPAGEPCVLLYGECCAGMDRIEAAPGRARTAGDNCAAIALGPERYRAERRAGAFFLMPEWTARWEGIFRERLGLADPALARRFFAENVRRFLYVDTGAGEVPPGLLAEIAGFVGAGIATVRAGTAAIEAALSGALAALGGRGRDGRG